MIRNQSLQKIISIILIFMLQIQGIFASVQTIYNLNPNASAVVKNGGYLFVDNTKVLNSKLAPITVNSGGTLEFNNPQSNLYGNVTIRPQGIFKTNATSLSALPNLNSNASLNLSLDPDTIFWTSALFKDDVDNVGKLPCSTWNIGYNGSKINSDLQTINCLPENVTRVNVLNEGYLRIDKPFTVLPDHELLLRSLTDLQCDDDLTIKGTLDVDRTANVKIKDGKFINILPAAIFESNFQSLSDFPWLCNVQFKFNSVLSTTGVLNDSAEDLGAIKAFTWWIKSTTDNSEIWPDDPGQTASSLSLDSCKISTIFVDEGAYLFSTVDNPLSLPSKSVLSILGGLKIMPYSTWTLDRFTQLNVPFISPPNVAILQNATLLTNRSTLGPIKPSWFQPKSILTTTSVLLDNGGNVGALPDDITWNINAQNAIQTVTSWDPKTTPNMQINVQNASILELTKTNINKLKAQKIFVQEGATLNIPSDPATHIDSNPGITVVPKATLQINEYSFANFGHFLQWMDFSSVLRSALPLNDEDSTIGSLPNQIAWCIGSTVPYTGSNSSQSLTNMGGYQTASKLKSSFWNLIVDKGAFLYADPNNALTFGPIQTTTVKGTIEILPSAMLTVKDGTTVILKEAGQVICNKGSTFKTTCQTFMPKINPSSWFKAGAILQTDDVLSDDENGVGLIPNNVIWNINSTKVYNPSNPLGPYQTAYFACKDDGEGGLTRCVQQINILAGAYLYEDKNHDFGLKNNQILTINSGGTFELIDGGYFSIEESAHIINQGNFLVGSNATLAIADKDPHKLIDHNIQMLPGSILKTKNLYEDVYSNFLLFPKSVDWMIGCTAKAEDTPFYQTAGECTTNIKVAPGANLYVDRASQLTIAKDQSLTVDDGGTITVQNGGVLNILHGANVTINGNGVINIQAGSVLRTSYFALNANYAVMDKTVTSDEALCKKGTFEEKFAGSILPDSNSQKFSIDNGNISYRILRPIINQIKNNITYVLPILNAKGDNYIFQNDSYFSECCIPFIKASTWYINCRNPVADDLTGATDYGYPLILKMNDNLISIDYTNNVQSAFCLGDNPYIKNIIVNKDATLSVFKLYLEANKINDYPHFAFYYRSMTLNQNQTLDIYGTLDFDYYTFPGDIFQGLYISRGGYLYDNKSIFKKNGATVNIYGTVILRYYDSPLILGNNGGYGLSWQDFKPGSVLETRKNMTDISLPAGCQWKINSSLQYLPLNSTLQGSNIISPSNIGFMGMKKDDVISKSFPDYYFGQNIFIANPSMAVVCGLGIFNNPDNDVKNPQYCIIEDNASLCFACESKALEFKVLAGGYLELINKIYPNKLGLYFSNRATLKIQENSIIKYYFSSNNISYQGLPTIIIDDVHYDYFAEKPNTFWSRGLILDIKEEEVNSGANVSQSVYILNGGILQTYKTNFNNNPQTTEDMNSTVDQGMQSSWLKSGYIFHSMGQFTDTPTIDLSNCGLDKLPKGTQYSAVGSSTNQFMDASWWIGARQTMNTLPDCINITVKDKGLLTLTSSLTSNFVYSDSNNKKYYTFNYRKNVKKTSGYENYTADKIAKLPALKVKMLTANDIRSLTATQIAGFTTSQIPLIPVEAIRGFTCDTDTVKGTTNNVTGLTSSQIGVFTAEQVAAIPLDCISTVIHNSIDNIYKYDSGSQEFVAMKDKYGDGDSGINVTFVALGLNPSPYMTSLNPDAILGLTSEQYKLINPIATQGLTSVQYHVLNSIVKYTPDNDPIYPLLTDDQYIFLKSIKKDGLTDAEYSLLQSVNKGRLTADQYNLIKSKLKNYLVPTLTRAEIFKHFSEPATNYARAVNDAVSLIISKISKNFGLTLKQDQIFDKQLINQTITVESGGQLIIPSDISGFSVNNLVTPYMNYTPDQMKALSDDQVAGMTINDIQMLIPSQIAALTTTISQLDVDQAFTGIKTLSGADLATWLINHYDLLLGKSISRLNADQISFLSNDQYSGLTTDQQTALIRSLRKYKMWDHISQGETDGNKVDSDVNAAISAIQGRKPYPVESILPDVISIQEGGTLGVSQPLHLDYMADWMKEKSNLITECVVDETYVKKIASQKLAQWTINAPNTAFVNNKGQTVASLNDVELPIVVKTSLFGTPNSTISLRNVMMDKGSFLQNAPSCTLNFNSGSTLTLDATATIVNMGTINVNSGATIVVNNNAIDFISGIVKGDFTNPINLNPGCILQTHSPILDDIDGVGSLNADWIWNIASTQTANSLPKTIRMINIMKTGILSATKENPFILHANQTLTIQAGSKDTKTGNFYVGGILKTSNSSSLDCITCYIKAGATLTVEPSASLSVGQLAQMSIDGTLNLDKDALVIGDRIFFNSGSVLQTNALKFDQIPGYRSFHITDAIFQPTDDFKDYSHVHPGFTEFNVVRNYGLSAVLHTFSAGPFNQINVIAGGVLSSYIGLNPNQTLYVQEGGKITVIFRLYPSLTHKIVVNRGGILELSNSISYISSYCILPSIIDNHTTDFKNPYFGAIIETKSNINDVLNDLSENIIWRINSSSQTPLNSLKKVSMIKIADGVNVNYPIPKNMFCEFEGSGKTIGDIEGTLILNGDLPSDVKLKSGATVVSKGIITDSGIKNMAGGVNWYVGSTAKSSDNPHQTAKDLKSDIKIRILKDSYLNSDAAHPLSISSDLTVDSGGTLEALSGSTLTLNTTNITNNGTISINSGATLITNATDFTSIKAAWLKPGSILQTTSNFTASSNIPTGVIWKIAGTQTTDFDVPQERTVTGNGTIRGKVTVNGLLDLTQGMNFSSATIQVKDGGGVQYNDGIPSHCTFNEGSALQTTSNIPSWTNFPSKVTWNIAGSQKWISGASLISIVSGGVISEKEFFTTNGVKTTVRSGGVFETKENSPTNLITYVRSMQPGSTLKTDSVISSRDQSFNAFIQSLNDLKINWHIVVVNQIVDSLHLQSGQVLTVEGGEVSISKLGTLTLDEGAIIKCISGGSLKNKGILSISESNFNNFNGIDFTSLFSDGSTLTTTKPLDDDYFSVGLIPNNITWTIDIGDHGYQSIYCLPPATVPQTLCIKSGHIQATPTSPLILAAARTLKFLNEKAGIYIDVNSSASIMGEILLESNSIQFRNYGVLTFYSTSKTPFTIGDVLIGNNLGIINISNSDPTADTSPASLISSTTKKSTATLTQVNNYGLINVGSGGVLKDVNNKNRGIINVLSGGQCFYTKNMSPNDTTVKNIIVSGGMIILDEETTSLPACVTLNRTSTLATNYAQFDPTNFYEGVNWYHYNDATWSLTKNYTLSGNITIPKISLNSWTLTIQSLNEGTGATSSSTNTSTGSSGSGATTATAPVVLVGGSKGALISADSFLDSGTLILDNSTAYIAGAADITKKNGDIAKIGEKIIILGGALDNIGKELKKINEGLTAISGDLTTIINEDLAAATRDPITIIKDIFKIKQDLNPINGYINTVNGDINTVNGYILTIDGDLIKINRDIIIIDNYIIKITGDLTKITGDLKTISDDLTTINGDLTAKNNFISAILDNIKIIIIDVIPGNLMEKASIFNNFDIDNLSGDLLTKISINAKKYINGISIDAMKEALKDIKNYVNTTSEDLKTIAKDIDIINGDFGKIILNNHSGIFFGKQDGATPESLSAPIVVNGDVSITGLNTASSGDPLDQSKLCIISSVITNYVLPATTTPMTPAESAIKKLTLSNVSANPTASYSGDIYFEDDVYLFYSFIYYHNNLVTTYPFGSTGNFYYNEGARIYIINTASNAIIPQIGRQTYIKGNCTLIYHVGSETTFRTKKTFSKERNPYSNMIFDDGVILTVEFHGSAKDNFLYSVNNFLKDLPVT